MQLWYLNCEKGLLFVPNDLQEEPPSKKKRVESSTNWTGTFAACADSCWNTVSVCVNSQSVLNFFVLSDEVDEIEVYGSEAQSGTQLATYSFEVRKLHYPIGCGADVHRG